MSTHCWDCTRLCLQIWNPLAKKQPILHTLPALKSAQQEVPARTHTYANQSHQISTRYWNFIRLCLQIWDPLAQTQIIPTLYQHLAEMVIVCAYRSETRWLKQNLSVCYTHAQLRRAHNKKFQIEHTHMQIDPTKYQHIAEIVTVYA